MNTETLQEKVQQQAVRPIRVLHVLDHSWPVHTGYSIRSLHLVAAQYRLGLRPRVLTGPLQLVDDPEAADAVVEDISYRRTPYSGSFSEWAIAHRLPLIRGAAVVQLIRNRILELLESEPVDIIHAHSPALCGLGALLAARSKNLPFVYELRAFWEDAAVDQNKTTTRSLRYRLSQKLEDYVVHRADAVVGISQSILDELKKRKTDSARLFHVPNGVDVEKFSPISRDESLAAKLGLGSDPVLGFIGSLYRWEGIAWLVRAVAELRRRGTACKLLIVGDGEEMAAVREAVRELNAEDFVQILGRVPHDEIERYYSVVDVLVYPRHSIRLTELVTPLKPLEAMALGKAILGSDVGGMRELVKSERTGILYRADNVEDFCLQAKRLLSQPSLQRKLGEEAREFILREKDWKVLAQRYIGIYDSAIRNRQCSN
ncbi:MAG TPA: glycosyltransferase [Candidatus Limnocylindria bacterium]|nr:glycosyltransferase [Candidatus Limnocylindria bacterium]